MIFFLDSCQKLLTGKNSIFPTKSTFEFLHFMEAPKREILKRKKLWTIATGDMILQKIAKISRLKTFAEKSEMKNVSSCMS